MYLPEFRRWYNEPGGTRVTDGIIAAQQKAIMQDVKHDNPINPERQSPVATAWLNIKPNPVRVSMVPRVMSTPGEILAAREAQRKASKKGG